MEFDIEKHTIFLTVSGSRAYGIAKPTSDYDYRGMAIAPMDCYIGIKSKFEQTVDPKVKHVYKNFTPGLLQTDPRVEGNDPNEAPDMQIMELTKFVRLALENNPNVIETLFIDPKFHVIKNDIVNKLIDNRHKLISKRVKARFAGYAFSELRKIKHHKHWLDNPITKRPERSDFGLPEHSIIDQDQLGAIESIAQKHIEDFMIDQTDLSEELRIELWLGIDRIVKSIWSAINPKKEYPIGYGKQYSTINESLFWGEVNSQGFSDNFLEVLARERSYRAAKKEYDSYQSWLKERNPERAELERKWGFDLKNASQLIRLLNCSREMITTGNLTVERPEAEFLKSVRAGALTYDQVIAYAEKEDREQNELLKSCTLPSSPDYDFFDGLVKEMILDFNKLCHTGDLHHKTSM